MSISEPTAAMYGSDRADASETKVGLRVARAAAEDILRSVTPDREALRVALLAAKRIRERRKALLDTSLEQIAGMAGFTLADVVGPSRAPDVVEVRRIIVRYLRDQDPPMSWPEIGRVIKRDHTTALYLYQPTRYEREQPEGAA